MGHRSPPGGEPERGGPGREDCCRESQLPCPRTARALTGHAVAAGGGALLTNPECREPAKETFAIKRRVTK